MFGLSYGIIEDYLSSAGSVWAMIEDAVRVLCGAHFVRVLATRKDCP